MNPKFNSRDLNAYFKNYQEKNSAYILGLIIISLGLYVLTWIYSVNKDLENLDSDAPSSIRGAMLLFILPLVWFFISTYLRVLSNSIIFEFIQITIFIVLYILILKYLYEFTLSFSHITSTKPIIWFGSIFIGSLGIFGYYTEFYYLFFLFSILLLIVPAMQEQLNTTYHKITIKKTNISFYS
ncbi:MAG: hypothetical protein ACMXYB_01860 [Candidatus Woesearchaeota archaeon]